MPIGLVDPAVVPSAHARIIERVGVDRGDCIQELGKLGREEDGQYKQRITLAR